MSRILFVNQHYWPDIASTGQHLTDLAEHCAADGFDVTVLCAQGRYLAGELEAPAREVHKGVAIRRVRTTSFGRGTNAGRIADYAGFYAKALRHLAFGPRYDLVVVLTTPPLLGYAAALARKLRGRPYAIWSMDLHPDAEEAIGVVTPGSPAARLLHRLNDAGYRNASLVVDLGFVMKDRLRAKGVRDERLRTIEVWSDGEEVRPVPAADHPLRSELGLDGRFVVMYSGNAGLAHRFDEVLEVMRRLKDDPRFFFLFVGSGPRKREIEAYVAQHGIENSRYVGYFAREQLAESLSIADVHLLTLRADMAGIAVPGKLYGVMAAGRPTVMVGPRRSEPAETIETERVGFVVDPETDPDPASSLLAHLLGLAADEPARLSLGDHARARFLDRYDRPVLCKLWADTLRDQISSRPGPSARGMSGSPITSPLPS